MALRVDRGLENSDWIRQSWDLPPYKSEQFNGLMARWGMTLEDFRKLPTYKNAVKKGLIVEDEWAGPADYYS